MIEYKKDFDAFVDLYQELLDRYKILDCEDEWFEMDFVNIEHNAWLPRFIKNLRNEGPTYESDLIDYGLDELIKMEGKVVALERLVHESRIQLDKDRFLA